MQQGARGRGRQEAGVAQALVALALDEESAARNNLELLLVVELDALELLACRALGGVEL
jgi:hypothetical protein